jgi:hypothetical protein
MVSPEERGGMLVLSFETVVFVLAVEESSFKQTHRATVSGSLLQVHADQVTVYGLTAILIVSGNGSE